MKSSIFSRECSIFPPSSGLELGLQLLIAPVWQGGPLQQFVPLRNQHKPTEKTYPLVSVYITMENHHLLWQKTH